MHIGVRAHDFGKRSAEELAARIASKGFSCVQLALSKAIDGVELKPGELNPGMGFQIGRAFYRHGIQIAVLGCYVNPLHPDIEVRKGLLHLFKEHLRFAREFGNGLVALETGSLNGDYSPHRDNHGEQAFNTLIESLTQLVAEAERFGVIVGIEGVTGHVANTPQRMQRVLETIGSNNLQVVFDPVNLLSIENCHQQDHVVGESFELFGDRIVIIHAKDFQVRGSELRQVRAGQGGFNYPHLLRLLGNKKSYISFILEDVTEDTAEESRRFLLNAVS
jgi:L-ribulose-5-phosphate 3-epimerase